MSSKSLEHFRTTIADMVENSRAKHESGEVVHLSVQRGAKPNVTRLGMFEGSYISYKQMPRQVEFPWILENVD